MAISFRKNVQKGLLCRPLPYVKYIRRGWQLRWHQLQHVRSYSRAFKNDNSEDLVYILTKTQNKDSVVGFGFFRFLGWTPPLFSLKCIRQDKQQFSHFRMLQLNLLNPTLPIFSTRQVLIKYKVWHSISIVRSAAGRFALLIERKLLSHLVYTVL